MSEQDRIRGARKMTRRARGAAWGPQRRAILVLLGTARAHTSLRPESSEDERKAFEDDPLGTGGAAGLRTLRRGVQQLQSMREAVELASKPASGDCSLSRRFSALRPCPPPPFALDDNVLLVTVPRPEILAQRLHKQHDPRATAWEDFKLPASPYTTKLDAAAPPSARPPCEVRAPTTPILLSSLSLLGTLPGR
ncbi:hypothetical protein C8F04DRAFT_1283089 [Mycena alexandri]|uniref:Uncharacterized protein n=1 Tax=Mycena alexandri TaxID=1745969 RepID=A0AAD6RVX0_9AGAR|nr:hypothetical protein C8F04DRAFT_1283089 [Mycena alexandri]